jgi:hypothetical protein
MPDLIPRVRADGRGDLALPGILTGAGEGAAPSRWQRRYRLHGLLVEVTADDPAVLDRVHPVLAHLGLALADEAGKADVVLRYPARPGAVQIPATARMTAEQDGIRAWSGGGLLYLECDGHAVHLDLSAGVAESTIPPAPTPPRKDIVIYTLLLLLRRRGLYALHASGVARAGAGFLFVAPCGSGKSTQTYGLVRQGWEYLGDDALLLRVRGDAVEALALRRDLCLDPALAHAFPEVVTHGEGGPFAARGKRRLRMRALHPGRLIERCVPRVLVFPEIVPNPVSRLAPLGPAETLARLVEQSVVVALDPDALPAHFEALGRLARQARGWRLLAGRDLKERPGAVAALLAGIHESGAPTSSGSPR